jgi:enoyl-CoA hydratase/carnithine racemase
MSDDLVLVERPEPHVAILRLNRPRVRNALNAAMRDELAGHCHAIAADDSVRVVIITGGPEHFAAGADLSEFVNRSAADILRDKSWDNWRAVADLPQPVIAAVNGFCLGGGLELAMGADIIIAGENAKLGQPEVRVGIMPGAGGTQRLARAVGKFAAMRMVLMGAMISGTEAKTLGLASEVVADDKVLNRALEIAREMASLPPLALQSAKQAILMGETASLEQGLYMERKAFEVLFATRDKQEGMEAFLQKRQANFSGE